MQGPKPRHIRIEPTGFVYPKNDKTEQNVYNVDTEPKVINGVYNYPIYGWPKING